MVRHSFAVLWLGVAVAVAVACGGSSARKTNDQAEDGGTSGGATPDNAGGSDPGTGATGDGATGSGAAGAGGSGVAGAGATGAVTGSGATGAVASGGAGGNGAGPGGSVAGSQGVPIDPPGPVVCGGVECDAPLACCLATQLCFDPSVDADACPPPEQDADPWGRPTCGSNADCDSGYFCQLENGLCQGTGHCHPIDNCGGCLDGGAGTCKVCGCDGNTYLNSQTACLARTNVVGWGGAGCGETVTSGGGGSGGEIREHTLCAVDSHCEADDKCCSITGLCYPASDPDQCRLPPEGTRAPCTSNAQCASYEYCRGEGCSGPGGCVSLGSQSECGVTLEPVCGCDAVTYTSAACAASRGVRIANTGECDAAN